MERIIIAIQLTTETELTKRMGRSITQEDVDLLESITDEEINDVKWDSRYTNCTEVWISVPIKGVRQLVSEMKKDIMFHHSKKEYERFMKLEGHNGEMIKGVIMYL